MFFLDDEDLALVNLRRGDHMKAGFALQVVTARWLGTFLEDPLDVPAAVLDFVAGQLGLADPSVVKKYAERVKTKSDHQQEIRQAYGLRDFAGAEAELVGWVAARAWTSGDGPKALDQIAEITTLELAGLGAEVLVPPRRLGELARYGMTADAWLICRHPDDRRTDRHRSMPKGDKHQRRPGKWGNSPMRATRAARHALMHELNT